MGCGASTVAPPPRKTKPPKLPKNFHDLVVPDIKGNLVELKKLKGKVLLVVNVASRCGHAMRNYREMIGLHQRYGGPEFEVLAVPCNQFFNQEPGTDEEIEDFVRKQGGTFLIMGKCNVNGQAASPLYRYLKKYCKDHGAVGWNFTKYLVSKDGVILQRYGYKTYPYSFEREIVALLEGDYSNSPPLPEYDNQDQQCANDILRKPSMQQLFMQSRPKNIDD